MLTWRCIWIIFWKVHDGLEVSSIVERVRVQNDEGNTPSIYVILIQLQTVSGGVVS